MDNKRFTILIPTRERADTLKWSLKTCLNQDYDNLEVIVSDNFSQDNTREVVESFRDERIKYVRTEKRVSMSSNWEFALSHVSNGFVTIIGDDDGILPNSISKISNLLSENGNPECLTWQYANYYWDNHNLSHLRSSLFFSLENTLSKRNSSRELLKLAKFEQSYFELPSLYNSFVNYDVIQKVFNKSGKVFCSSNPDVYSAIAIASVTESYLYSERPYGIAGLSGHSTGSGFSNADVNDKSKKLFLEETSIPFHPRIAICAAPPFLIAESFLQAIDNNLLPKDYPLSISNAIKMGLLVCRNFDPFRFNSVIKAARDTAKRNGLEDWVESEISETRNRPAKNEKVQQVLYEALSNSISLRADLIGVENVYDASLLVNQLIVLNENGMLKNDKVKVSAKKLLKAFAKKIIPTKTYYAMREWISPVFK